MTGRIEAGTAIPLPGTRTPAGDVGVPDAVGRDWSLWNQDTVTAPLVRDITSNATDVVNLEFFAFNDEGKGAQIVDAAKFAARRGREVNVFVDSASNLVLPLGSYQRMQREIRDAGGTAFDNLRGRASLGMLAPDGQRHVDHRKTVVIDGGRIAWTGGVNFVSMTDDYDDSMLRMTGRPAAELGVNQLDRWRRVGGEVTPRHQGLVDARQAAAQLMPAAPDELTIRHNAPEQELFELSDDYRRDIDNATRRAWISSPAYSDGELIDRLEHAARRGVDVRLVGSSHPPLRVPLFNWAAESHQRAVGDAGGSTYLIPGVLHRKALLTDDTAIMSSYNATVRSRKADHEIGVRSSDPKFVRAIEATLLEDMARAVQLDPSSTPRLGVKFASLFTRRLGLSY